MNTVLVTGGAGFIGSHLCKYLIRQNHRVYCIDNLYSGSLDNLTDIMNHPNFTFIKEDVSKSILPDITNINYDQIFHLACPASPPYYQKQPISTLDTCYIGTKQMLEIAKKQKSRILLTSTSEVYGDPLEHPQVETYNGNVSTTSIRACYDEGKRVAETLMTEYNRVHNVDTRIVRIFNTYGPNLNPEDGRVVSNFICQALKGENITIYGDGSQTRSLCYVSDMVRGLVSLMNYTGEDKHSPFNIGNPVEMSILEIAKIVVNLTNSSSSMTFHPLPQNDPKKRKPDITKSQKLLGWNPNISAKEGLEKTIEYFNNLIM